MKKYNLIICDVRKIMVLRCFNQQITSGILILPLNKLFSLRIFGRVGFIRNSGYKKSPHPCELDLDGGWRSELSCRHIEFNILSR